MARTRTMNKRTAARLSKIVRAQSADVLPNGKRDPHAGADGFVECANGYCHRWVPQARANIAVTHGLCVLCNEAELTATREANEPEHGTARAERASNDDGFSARLLTQGRIR